jgi:hypothetical protein
MAPARGWVGCDDLLIADQLSAAEFGNMFRSDTR